MRDYASEGFIDGEMRMVNSGLVLANRGCPFGCNFCYLFFGQRLRRQRRYLSKGRIAFTDIDEAVAQIRNAGMEVLAFVMVGLPNETESSLRSLNAWLESSQAYYSLSTFQRRLGTPLANEDVRVAPESWDHLDASSEFLGESPLQITDLTWFAEFHATNPRRVANIMRQQRVMTG